MINLTPGEEMDLSALIVKDVLVIVYKISCLLVGYGCTRMGFLLFKAGIWGEAGDVDAKFQDNRIVFKKAAPGTFFAVLGSAIILATVIVGFKEDMAISKATTDAEQAPQPPANVVTLPSDPLDESKATHETTAPPSVHSGSSSAVHGSRGLVPEGQGGVRTRTLPGSNKASLCLPGKASE